MVSSPFDKDAVDGAVLEARNNHTTSESAPTSPSQTSPGNSATANDHAVPPLAESWREEPLTLDEQAKVQRILQACKDRDLPALTALATSPGGFVEDQIRRTAWPVLLGSDREEADAPPDWHTLDPHQDEGQVDLDVNRSFVYYPDHESEKTKDARKQDLSGVIVEVLRRHPMLHYFQGYHDIVQVLLLVLGANAAVPAVARLSLLRIRDFMLPTMAATETHLQLVPAILYAADPGLCMHLSQTQPFFALAATLTLYAHDIEEYGDIARLFDFLLAHEAIVSLYLFATIVMSRKKELLEIEPEEPEMLHATLSKLPKPLNLEALIERTDQLFRQYPPHKLPGRGWSRVPLCSVLKTTHDQQVLAKQSLKDGERLFRQHASDIRRSENLKRTHQQVVKFATSLKRPALFTSAAIVIAVIGIVLRDNRYGPAWFGWFSSSTGLSSQIMDFMRKRLG